MAAPQPEPAASGSIDRSRPEEVVTPSPANERDDIGMMEAILSRVLSVQRPVVLAYVARIRRKHPHDTPAAVVRRLERQYVAATATGGAAVGASAVIPGIGFFAGLGLSGAETAGFLGATALFAQAITEVHGIAIDDPDRERALVMALMLGGPGRDLVKRLATQALGEQVGAGLVGELVTASLPKHLVSGIGSRLRDTIIRRYARRQGAAVLGRTLPFGVGAAVGGLGNRSFAKKVVKNARVAFGPAPDEFSANLGPSRTPKKRRGKSTKDAQGQESG